MKVLVACEYSGTVRDAFIAAGHDATSCDFLPTDKPGPHYQGNVLDIVHKPWDLMIAHPSCTFLCSSGLHWNKKRPERQQQTEEALDFVRLLLGLPIPKIALENPIGCIGTQIRPASQIIQPWQYGEDASKATCLWLKGLPLLKPTEVVPARFGCKCGHTFNLDLGALGCPKCGGVSGKAKSVWGNQTASGQNKLGPSPDRWKLRSTTYKGIAEAFANQWGKEI